MRNGTLVTGLGVIGCCGRGPRSLWRSLLTGQANHSRIRHFDTYGSRTSSAGLVPGEEDQAGDPNRLLHLLVTAAREALIDAGLDGERDAALVVGTTNAGEATVTSPRTAAAEAERPQPAFTGWLAHHAAVQLGLTGEALTVSTASASGGSALCVAQDLIAAGEARAVVVAGVDCVTESAFHGLRSLRTLSPGGCRPFSAERSGIGISEGAAGLVLEAADGRRKPTRVYALLAGCGASNETSQLTVSDARGIARALERALADAQLDADEIDLVNAHAPGTRAGDAVEVKALRSVFGEALDRVALVSTKGVLWHWQGAAGMVEALACILSLSKKTITPTHGAEPLDPAWDDLDIVLKSRPSGPCTALSVSCGLGGINTAAVFASRP
jgi:3-oxoacyl-(acyl-carrier-protein) synthase